MPVDIDGLSLEELIQLNHRVVERIKRVFDLEKDFGTSESPKSTRSSTAILAPGPPCVRCLAIRPVGPHRKTTPTNGWTRCSDAYFASPLARKRTSGKPCGLIATGDYAPSLRSPWRAAEALCPCHRGMPFRWC